MLMGFKSTVLTIQRSLINANIENISIGDVNKSLLCSKYYISEFIFQPIGYLRKLKQWNLFHNRSWICEIFVDKYFNYFSWLRYFLEHGK